MNTEIKQNPICCICGRECENKHGNNPYPYTHEEGARCCDICNNTKVRLMRQKSIEKYEKY